MFTAKELAELRCYDVMIDGQPFGDEEKEIERFVARLLSPYISLTPERWEARFQARQRQEAVAAVKRAARQRERARASPSQSGRSQAARRKRSCDFFRCHQVDVARKVEQVEQAAEHAACWREMQQEMRRSCGLPDKPLSDTEIRKAAKRKEYDRERRRVYYQAHKEQVLASRRAYYQSHKEQSKAQASAWYQAHKGEYYHAHREEILAKARAVRAAKKERSASGASTSGTGVSP